jgi:acyl carrier protein
MIPLSVPQAFRVLDTLLKRSDAQVAVMQVDWAKIAIGDQKYLTHLVESTDKQEGEWITLFEAISPDKHEQILTSNLRLLLADILNIPQPENIDVNKGFFEMGMDSLLAVDFKNKIEEKIGNKYPIRNTVIFDYPTITKLRSYIIDEILLNFIGDDAILSDDFLSSFEDELKNLSGDVDE